MIYFFHHYELPVIVQQAQLQQMFMRSVRTNNNNNNNQQADNGQATAATPAAGGGNQQMNRENQQAPTEAPTAAVPERPTNNTNNMFVVRGTYRRRVNHLVERLRNNFYNNVFGVGLIADNNNINNAANNLQNQPGFNNLTRSLRLLNLLFPNRPILNVRIINVRSASAAATVADIMRTVESNQQNAENQIVNQPASDENSGGEFPSVVRLEESQEGEESSREATAPALSEEQPSPPDPSHTNEAGAEPESSIKHRDDHNVNNSVNVMQSSTNGDGEGSQTTSSSNEQCWAWMRSVFSYEF